jgi:hypothetical protein
MASLHCVYKTFHPETGKYYIGKGRTVLVESGKYKGSGKILLDSFKKYAREQWITIIIRTFDDEECAYAFEGELVNDATLKDPLCLNIKRGGEGGSQCIQSLDTRAKRSVSMKKALSTTEAREKLSRNASRSQNIDGFSEKKSASIKKMWIAHRDKILEGRDGKYGDSWKQKLSNAAKKSRRQSFKVEVFGKIYPKQADAMRALSMTRKMLRKHPTFKEI